jgi:tetratricopeptide (TPR) repeat protein
MKALAPLWLCALLLGHAACAGRNREELLRQHRNLGKAFYENPVTQEESVREFRQALQLAPDSPREKVNYALALLRVSGRDDEAARWLQAAQQQDPSLPHTWFNLGMYYKRRGDVDQAMAQFQGMIERSPGEPIGYYQLGALYRQLNRNAEAQRQFERAAELDPQLAAAPFQLYNLHRLAGDTASAARYLADFQRIQEAQKTWVTPEDVEWCQYAEIYDPPEERVPGAAAPEPTFTDIPVEGSVDVRTGALALIDSTGAGQTDLLAWSARGIQVFRRGRQPAVSSGLEGLRGTLDVAPGDFDNDGLMDLCVITAAGPALYRNTGGRFVKFPLSLPARRFERAVWLDYDHDYDLDLVLLGDQPAVRRNQGPAGWQDRTTDFPFVKGAVLGAQKLRLLPDSKAFDLAVFYRDRAPVLYRDLLGGRYAVEAFQATAIEPSRTQVEADFDDDGRLDRARIDGAGGIHLMHNQTNSNRHWIRVRLTGVRSLKLSQDALVEIKAGSFYRRAFYNGVPMLLDAGDRATIDTVRITWPNGLIQNELRQASGQTHTYVEAPRLSGSCPMIWTWNGHGYQFIADVLGVSPLGVSDGDGSFFETNHVEWIQVAGHALQPVDGRYDVRVTEELSEVSYLDQIQLYAVDHRAEEEIFTNEKFKGRPFPEFRLFAVQKRIHPQAARDDHGHDVLGRLMAEDQRYPDDFQRSENGVAEMHTLELDFGSAAPSGQALLVLNGWFDWPDGSIFRKAAQESKGGLTTPLLQLQDSQGRWITANPDMGMPSGKPRTIAVPVTFPAASRKMRIVTNMCLYWDEIFLSENVQDAGVTPKPVPLLSADLRFRGFSEVRAHGQNSLPDTYVYDRVSATSYWNPTPGLYTRFGSVAGLLSDVDDRLVIMGSGDEVRLQFDAKSLPALAQGWSRDFLVKVDGWAKDRDPNTAFSKSVLPLPFHAMSRYPYPPGERYPRDAAHDQYQRQYNTRPAGILLGPLESR